MTPEQILEGLNPEQCEFALHKDGPVMVEALAGSGKTMAIVRRVAYLCLVHKVRPERILAITFTKKASVEMRERIAAFKLPCEVRTFHSLAHSILREDFPGFDNWQLDEGHKIAQIIEDVCDGKSPDDNQFHRDFKLSGRDPTLIEQYIGLCKADLLPPWDLGAKELAIKLVKNTYPPTDMRPSDLVHAYDFTERFRIDSRLMGFDDWIFEVVKLFRENESVRAKWAAKFDYVMQDECQDESLGQETMVSMLATDHRNYAVIGDRKQSLFGWRGARPSLMGEFYEKWNPRVIYLEKNYRSVPEILEFANTAVASMPGDDEARLMATRAEHGQVKLNWYESQEREAEDIARQINEAHENGTPWKSFCILYRTNAHSRACEEAFARAKIPYFVVGGVPFFSRAECRDLIAYLRVAAKRGTLDTTLKDARLCMNRPSRYLGKQFLDRVNHEAYAAKAAKEQGVGWADLVERAAAQSGLDKRRKHSALEWVNVITDTRERMAKAEAYLERKRSFNEVVLSPSEMLSGRADSTDNGGYEDEDEDEDIISTKGFLKNYTPSRIIQNVADQIGYLNWLKRQKGRDTPDVDRITNVAELIRAADQFSSLKEFLDHVDVSTASAKLNRANEGEVIQPDRVTLMTVYRAKGLEWPYVYFVTCNDGVLPHIRSRNIDEERRVFYVGVTRARDGLQVSWVERACSNGTMKPLNPSPFIPKEYIAIAKSEKVSEEESDGVDTEVAQDGF